MLSRDSWKRAEQRTLSRGAHVGYPGKTGCARPGRKVSLPQPGPEPGSLRRELRRAGFRDIVTDTAAILGLNVPGKGLTA